jgi:hypothetical protein
VGGVQATDGGGATGRVHAATRAMHTGRGGTGTTSGACCSPLLPGWVGAWSGVLPTGGKPGGVSAAAHTRVAVISEQWHSAGTHSLRVGCTHGVAALTLHYWQLRLTRAAWGGRCGWVHRGGGEIREIRRRRRRRRTSRRRRQRRRSDIVMVRRAALKAAPNARAVHLPPAHGSPAAPSKPPNGVRLHCA